MANGKIVQFITKAGEKIYGFTHIDSVRDDAGNTGTAIIAAQVATRQPAVSVTSHGTSDVTIAPEWDTKHVWGDIGGKDLTLTLPAAPEDSKDHEIILFFKSGSTAVNFICPNGILNWKNKEGLVPEANTAYEVNISYMAGNGYWAAHQAYEL